MEDHDFQVVRKNLNILSILILILAYTSAKLDSFNFLGLQLELIGSKLYQALYVGYAYFIWRFLTKLPLISGFWNDFLQYYITSEKGVKKQHNYERYKKQFIDKSERLKYSIETNDPQLWLTQFSVIRLSAWPLTQLRLSAHLNASKREGENDMPQFNVEHDINVSRFLLFRKLIFFCIKYDKFGDYLFPIIPVFINLLFFLLKSEWQGSVNKIFS
jgi:hypothetical protein